MSPIRRIADLSTLLALPGVVEELELGSTFGVCALHGGGLERATEVVAREVAGRTGASYYGVLQPEGSRHHLSSTGFDPSASPRLADFLGRVETIVSIHGYGRDDDFFAVLLGGTNRPFANHLAGHLRGTLPDDFRVVDDLAEMPRRLRGIHPRNPVNRPRHGGVQVELPPSIRWNIEAHDWSDRDGTPRAPQLDDLIDGLVAGAIGWDDVACGDVA